MGDPSAKSLCCTTKVVETTSSASPGALFRSTGNLFIPCRLANYLNTTSMSVRIESFHISNYVREFAILPNLTK